MGFREAIASALNGYVRFSGRSSRSEYWWFALAVALGHMAIGLVEGAVGLLTGEVGILGLLFSLVILLPSLAVSVRRLHDVDRSGWWLLLWFIPLIGLIVLLVWACTRGTPGDNRFGPDPLDCDARWPGVD